VNRCRRRPSVPARHLSTHAASAFKPNSLAEASLRLEEVRCPTSSTGTTMLHLRCDQHPQIQDAGSIRIFAHERELVKRGQKHSARFLRSSHPSRLVLGPWPIRLMHPMDRFLTALATVALCLGVSACGGAGAGSPTGASASRSAIVIGSDRDNDNDHNDDDAHVLNYGHAASPTDEREAVALVKRYFALAATGDGAQACRLLVPLLAETVAEQDGGSPGLRGRTCGVVVSKLFIRDHRVLAEKDAHLKVIEVRVNGDKGLILLDFTEIPEVRQILERRVDGAWKLHELFDGIIE
jgi:hypothetical protein